MWTLRKLHAQNKEIKGYKHRSKKSEQILTLAYSSLFSNFLAGLYKNTGRVCALRWDTDDGEDAKLVSAPMSASCLATVMRTLFGGSQHLYPNQHPIWQSTSGPSIESASASSAASGLALISMSFWQ